MSAIRQPGKINENTILIDIGMNNIYRMTAVYLVQGKKKALIDGGTRQEASRLVKTLKELDAFPPDLIIPTHPHWDHTQAIPVLQQIASQQGKKIEILASHDAISPLADVSFNIPYDSGPYEPIQGVTPLKEGDKIDLGGINLQIFEIPGHCRGHIALLDEKNRNLFVGDAIGNKFSDEFFFPPFMPPTWDTNAFLTSVNKLKHIPYETLCLAHFGCIYGDEARNILDEAVDNFNTWWQWYERHVDRLDDPDFLLKAMRTELNPRLPEVKPVSFWLKALLPLVIFIGTITGKKTAILDRLILREPLMWLAEGFKAYYLKCASTS